MQNSLYGNQTSFHECSFGHLIFFDLLFPMVSESMLYDVPHGHIYNPKWQFSYDCFPSQDHCTAYMVARYTLVTHLLKN